MCLVKYSYIYAYISTLKTATISGCKIFAKQVTLKDTIKSIQLLDIAMHLCNNHKSVYTVHAKKIDFKPICLLHFNNPLGSTFVIKI